MSVIPDFVIQDWRDQYNEDGDLWTTYSEVDRERVLDAVDLDEIQLKRKLLLPAEILRPEDPPKYVASAGGPLARKSTILERYLGSDGLENMVRVDPDQWGMRFMVETYIDYLMSSSMIAGSDYPYAQRRAYDVARPASNFITLEVLNAAAKKKANIAHGTTMTSPHISSLLNSIKGEGYDITLLLCDAPDDVRAAGQEFRSSVQGYYQATPEDIRNKGWDFPQRMEDYFKYGDILEVFWTDSFDSETEHAATFDKGELTVHSNGAFSRFINNYIEKSRTLAERGTRLPSFDSIRTSYLGRSFG
ncbi:MAG: zeta toxin family protein [Pseudomonadota bacterium]